MTDEMPTIERLIASGYAAGEFTDACWAQVLLRIEAVAHRVCRGLLTAWADEVRGRTIEKVRRALEGGLGKSPEEIVGTPGLYDPGQSFDAWCRSVVTRCASDVKNRRWTREECSPHSRGDDAAPGSPAIAMNEQVDKRTPAPSRASEQQEFEIRALTLFERLIPEPRTRIVVAVQHGYIDFLPNDVVRGWCEDADLDDITAALREIAGAHGSLKAICDLLPGVTHDNVRAMASRGQKRLRDGGFIEALGGDG